MSYIFQGGGGYYNPFGGIASLLQNYYKGSQSTPYNETTPTQSPTTVSPFVPEGADISQIADSTTPLSDYDKWKQSDDYAQHKESNFNKNFTTSYKPYAAADGTTLDNTGGTGEAYDKWLSTQYPDKYPAQEPTTEPNTYSPDQMRSNVFLRRMMNPYMGGLGGMFGGGFGGYNPYRGFGGFGGFRGFGGIGGFNRGFRGYNPYQMPRIDLSHIADPDPGIKNPSYAVSDDGASTAVDPYFPTQTTPTTTPTGTTTPTDPQNPYGNASITSPTDTTAQNPYNNIVTPSPYSYGSYSPYNSFGGFGGYSPYGGGYGGYGGGYGSYSPYSGYGGGFGGYGYF